MPLHLEGAASNEETRAKPNPCAGCEKPAEAAVWGTQLCYSCIAAWDGDAPTQFEAEKKYPDDSTRYRALQDFTTRWADKRKAKARAA